MSDPGGAMIGDPRNADKKERLITPEALRENFLVWNEYLDKLINYGTSGEKEKAEIFAAAKEIAQNQPLIHVAPISALPEIVKDGGLIPHSEAEKAPDVIRSNTFDFDIELGLNQYVFADFNNFRWSIDQRIGLYIDPRSLRSEGTAVTMRDFADYRLMRYPEAEQKQLYLQEAFSGKDFYDTIFPKLLSLAYKNNQDEYFGNRSSGFWNTPLPSPYPGGSTLVGIVPEAKLPKVNLSEIMGVYYEPSMGIVSAEKEAKLKQIVKEFEGELARIRKCSVDELFFPGANRLKCTQKAREILSR